MAAFIIGAEFAFWILIGLGLLFRYVFKLRRVSTFILLLVPMVDVVLLAVSVKHMRDGATADITHTLAALYLGYSVVFGHAMVRWADQRVAHRFFGGPPPVKPPKYGMARAKSEWIWTAKAVLAWGISMGVAYLMVWLVADSARTDALVSQVVWTLKVPVIAGIIALSYTIWPKKPKAAQAPEQRQWEPVER
ncbi:hypothetical protein Afil01_69120 [Actinorhabdospora filicis]|uniref:Uncharacterized protein n=1 Tax=Actinorhabdospora filicis TaxID=1785913 RepID=A0A9W6SSJ5_9ACTN|nr:hypothetical protein [Actinorhabdospora filicis]GLZ82105.1 hypothetical protein Afil01_69120 [Actinorhabdospora filicis]